LNQVILGKVGKKYAIYLPKSIVKKLAIKEGDIVEFRVVDNDLNIRFIRDPLWLAVYGRKYASIKPDAIERISVEEQERHVKDTA